jgi:2-phospho-L-lactate/phosphoenolpyruvate guanylyltransferase
MPPVDPALLVPVKAFSDAKARLSPVLSHTDRARLARWMADRVLAAAGELPVFVACDDEQVADWAESRGATVLWHPGVGLNPAVNASITMLRERDVRHVVVAHGDLPRVHALADVVLPGAVTLVPDRHGDGTNVVALPTACGFELSYGPSSFSRHLALAMHMGLRVQVRRDPLLGLDIDTPIDLAHPLVQEVLPAWLPTNQANPHSPMVR